LLQFERSVWINAPVGAVFAFHERPDAFAKLTPPGQPVSVISHAGGIETGARVVIRLGFGFVSIKWVAVHTRYEKNRLFEDTQESGPFRSWRHQHRFAAEGSGARLTDHIDFELPGGRVAERIFGAVIRAQLEKMFAYRHKVTKETVEAAAAHIPLPLPQ
jgi:ligand-binding SRPBCC domain-containing protein